MLDPSFGGFQVEKQFLINTPIVNVIIDELLWNPYDVKGVMHENIIKGFEDYAKAFMRYVDEEGGDRSRVIIKNAVKFYLAIDYLCVGCSFRQSAWTVHSVKKRTGLAAAGLRKDVTVNSQLVCPLCVCYKLEEEFWAFGDYLDVFDYSWYDMIDISTSYLNIHIRLLFNYSGIVNLHLLAVPIYKQHTAEVVIETTAKILDALCSDWRAVSYYYWNLDRWWERNDG